MDAVSIVSICVAGVSLVVAALAALYARQMVDSAENSRAQQYFSGLRKWSDECMNVITAALFLTAKLSAHEVLTEESFDSRKRELLVQLSALIHRGRWFFHNLRTPRCTNLSFMKDLMTWYVDPVWPPGQPWSSLPAYSSIIDTISTIPHGEGKMIWQQIVSRGTFSSEQLSLLTDQVQLLPIVLAVLRHPGEYFRNVSQSDIILRVFQDREYVENAAGSPFVGARQHEISRLLEAYRFLLCLRFVDVGGPPDEARNPSWWFLSECKRNFADHIQRIMNQEMSQTQYDNLVGIREPATLLDAHATKNPRTK